MKEYNIVRRELNSINLQMTLLKKQMNVLDTFLVQCDNKLDELKR